MKIVVLDGKALEPDLDHWSPIRQAIPKAHFQWWPNTEPDLVLDRAADADIVIVNKIKLGINHFEALPKLKMVAVSATGFDTVDLAAAKEYGVTVCNVPTYCTKSVAQHVFACLLHMIHRPLEHDRAIRAGQWQAEGQFAFWLSPLTELVGKTIGVVGFGRIGQATATLAKAFGMHVLIASRTRRDVPGFEDSDWTDVESLFRESDVVSLHCPQNQDTAGFVNKSLLSKMKRSAILINTARGGLINESDLADCLNRDVLAAACLDVVSSEPIESDNPLLSAKNCLLTPHLAWTTTESRMRLINLVAENIRAFADGEAINVVN